MITADEIRAQQFAKGIRGYDTNEVDAFLASLAAAWERQSEAFRRQKEELEALRGQLNRQNAVAEEVATVLAHARATAAAIVEAAEAKAQLVHESALLDRQRLALKHGETLAQVKAYLAAQLDRISAFEQAALQAAEAAPQNGPTPAP